MTVNTIFILRNLSGEYFLWHLLVLIATKRDYPIIKSHDLPAFVKCEWEVDGNLWTFREGEKDYQNQTSAGKVGGGVQSLFILW